MTTDVENDTRRLGRDVLGPHAFEKQMPHWQKRLIVDQRGFLNTIQYGSEPKMSILMMKNESYNTIPVLQALSSVDPNVTSFGYCHPATNHFHKRASLSGFCGYHSISSLLSYLRGCSTAPKHHRYATHLPNILEIQDIIEEGWRAGINSKALLQTGGIRGTRKYIGTSEAETCLKTLNVHCYVMCIQSNKEKMACDQVMERLERYFMREPAIGENMLGKPPVYFQYSGHSTVVVGFETWKERKLVVPGVVQMASEHLTELVVFDSARPATEEVRKVRDEAMPFEKLKAFLPVMAGYRVSRYELQKYDRFELVFLEDPKLF